MDVAAILTKRMSLEEQIVEWATSRPKWQQIVMRRVAVGETVSDQDYDHFANALVLEAEQVGETFGLNHLGAATLERRPTVVESAG